jgi:phospho-N-acetylmuramoyl-pentapeptide-transferase
MILLLFKWLSQEWGVKVPAAFSYCSTRMILAAMTTLLLTIFLGPAFIRKLYELKMGQTIRVADCPVLSELHKKKNNIPTMGGILILFSMIVALLFWMDLSNIYTLLLFITTFWLGGIGAYDDYLKLKYRNSKGMSGKLKLFLQLLLATGIAAYVVWPREKSSSDQWYHPPVAKEQIHVEKAAKTVALSSEQMMSRYYIPFYKQPLFILTGAWLLFSVFFTIFTITGASNAVNLTDGLDGLASGCLIMTSIVFALFGFLSNNIEISRYLNILYIEGSSEIAIYLAAMIGALLGFLWYNGHPAQVFMGDTGSLALGGIIGVSAVLLRREALLGLAGGIFVAEALSVIIQIASYRLRNRKRVFLCAPLHHHFEYKGWPETKVVIRFWIISLILAILAVSSIKIQ